jgi:transposase
MDRKTEEEDVQRRLGDPSDGEAEITKLKDGRTALAYKAENAVDMETGAIVAVTTHGGAVADTATVEGTIEAGVAVALLIARRRRANRKCIRRECGKRWRTRHITATLSRWASANSR